MIRNYFKIALRNLVRHKGYSFLNIAGLALGMACTMLILLYVQDELGFDRFHTNLSRIYRVNTGMNGDGQPSNANGQIAAGPALKRVFPEVETYVRFRKFGWNESRVVAYNNRRFYEKRFLVADSTVFRVFSFPLIEGDPMTALDAPNTVVLTRSMAIKYFGTEPAMGKRIQVDMYNDGRFSDFTVTGIAEDVPAQSSIQFDFLGSYSSQTDIKIPWSLESVFTFILFHENIDVRRVEAALPGFVKQERGPNTRISMHLQPMKDVRLRSPYSGQMEPPGNIGTVTILSSVAVFILLIACINFTNLSIARSMRRAREIGMRKVLGAEKRQLIFQFLGESVVVTTVSVLFGFILAESLMPMFNGLADKDLSLAMLGTMEGIAGVCALTLFVGVLAGAYPAYVLSRFTPVSVMKAGVAGVRGGQWVRKSLVVIQFSISVALLVCTAVAGSQLELIRTKNLGFDREQVLVLPLNDAIRMREDMVRKEILSNPDIISMALSEQVPGRAGNGSGYLMEGMEERSGAYRMFVDEHFLETYRIDLLAGRDFSGERKTDADEAFILNEAFLRIRGIKTPEEAVGKSFSMFHGGVEKKGRVIGITRDFHTQSLHDNIGEVLLTIMPLNKMNFISLRLAPGRLEETLTHLRDVWQREASAYPFDYYFLDDDFDRVHREDIRVGQIFGVFAALAMMVACLGLFGLASYAAEQRTKEIGIRRVLGASVTGVVALLSREFLLLVGTAVLIGWPVAYVGMDSWLSDFAYRTSMSWWLFAASGAAVIGIAVVTVSIQAAVTALRNPTEALKYE